MGAAGFGVVLMTAVLSAPLNSQYYAGLIMVVIYCGSLLGLRFAYSMMVTLGAPVNPGYPRVLVLV